MSEALSLLESLLEAAQNQRTALTEGRPDEAAAILEKRNEILICLNKLVTYTEPDRAELKAKTDEIMSVDNEIQTILRTGMHTIKEKLEGLNKTKEYISSLQNESSKNNRLDISA